jgi:hypothetical protein
VEALTVVVALDAESPKLGQRWLIVDCRGPLTAPPATCLWTKDSADTGREEETRLACVIKAQGGGEGHAAAVPSEDKVDERLCPIPRRRG